MIIIGILVILILGYLFLNENLKSTKYKEIIEEYEKTIEEYEKTTEEHEETELYLQMTLKNTKLCCEISRKQILKIMENIINEHYKQNKPSNSEYLEVIEEIHKIIEKTKVPISDKWAVITHAVNSSQKRLMDAITVDISQGVQENIMDIYHMIYDLILIDKDYEHLSYAEIIFLETVTNIVKLNLRNFIDEQSKLSLRDLIYGNDKVREWLYGDDKNLKDEKKLRDGNIININRFKKDRR